MGGLEERRGEGGRIVAAMVAAMVRDYNTRSARARVEKAREAPLPIGQIQAVPGNFLLSDRAAKLG